MKSPRQPRNLRITKKYYKFIAKKHKNSFFNLFSRLQHQYKTNSLFNSLIKERCAYIDLQGIVTSQNPEITSKIFLFKKYSNYKSKHFDMSSAIIEFDNTQEFLEALDLVDKIQWFRKVFSGNTPKQLALNQIKEINLAYATKIV